MFTKSHKDKIYLQLQL